MKKIGMLSLGCAKNLVDSEMMLAMFDPKEFSFTDDPAEADLILLNTCAFIEAARKESIDAFFQMLGAKKKGAKIVVLGCLAQRYEDELRKSLPEADLIVPIKDYQSLPGLLDGLLHEEKKDAIAPMNPLRRVVSTPSYSAYLRISEGCNNFCSFCAIPYIRGRFVSRPYEEILREAKQLKDSGVKEISLISQDTTRYGSDFPNQKPNIADLLGDLEKIGFYSIRLLYLYPDEISDELIDQIGRSKIIKHYFDIPVQCASDHLLKAMNRHGDKAQMMELFHKIRDRVPDAVLRTTLIAGFPGENEDDVEQTLAFLEEVRFDHLGCFTYSREEGTAAYKLPDQISEARKEEVRSLIMERQRHISYDQAKKHVGETMEGIVTGSDGAKGRYRLRSYWNAPDDIDGNIYFTSDRPLKEGEIVRVHIDSAFVYDLMGHLAEE